MKKIIFLDMDGVVWGYNLKRLTKRYPHSKECVDNLNRILEETSADIIWSSCWRLGETLESGQKILDTIGIKGKLVGMTPDMTKTINFAFMGNFRPYVPRRFEIEYYLQTSDIERFIILDDDPDAELNPPRENGLFIFTDIDWGLSFQQAVEAIEFLNSVAKP